MSLFIALFILLVCTSPILAEDYEGDYFRTGNDDLDLAISAAISEMLRLNSTDDNSFPKIIKRVFGKDVSIPIPPLSSCVNEVYPTQQVGVLGYILRNKEIVYGASSITRAPKIYDCTETSKVRKGKKLYKCNGFEAEVGQCVMNLMSKHYFGDESIQSYFVEVKWNYNATDNIGMGIDGKWTTSSGSEIDRNKIFHFSCPYQTGGSAIVAGEKEFPDDLININSLSSLNRSDVDTCVDYGTSMAHLLEDELTQGHIVYCGVNGTASSDCRKWTIEGTKCHVYIAPLLNALYDEKMNENLTMKYILEGDSSPVAIAMRYDYADFSVNSKPCMFIIVAVLLTLIM